VRIDRSTIKTAALVLWTLAFVAFLFFSTASAQQPLPEGPKPKNQPQTKLTSESSWPRTFTSGTNTFTIYQPQVDKWDENLISLYCAVELKVGKETAAKHGVVLFQARTEVDKVNRLVTLDQAKVTKVKFPVAQDKEHELTALLENQKQLRNKGAQRTQNFNSMRGFGGARMRGGGRRRSLGEQTCKPSGS
jgi:hypothetical protein